MDLKLRSGTSEDAEACGRICYEAFTQVAESHAFPPDFPSPDVAVGLISWILAHPGFYSVVAELDSRVVGSNFLDQRNRIAGVGPITIASDVQNRSIGRALMEAVHARAEEKSCPGIRLVQAGYHMRSLSLYATLGYEAREPLVCMQGARLNLIVEGYAVRTASKVDVEACNQLCLAVHGHDRGAELLDAIEQGTARVVEHKGRITGYATLVGFFGHAVAETNREIEALIGAADGFPGPGFLVPVRNGDLFRWCLAQKLRAVQPMTLMSRGTYTEPRGSFLPSILY